MMEKSLAACAKALRDGGLTAQELVGYALERARASALGGYRSLRTERVMEEAKAVDAVLGSGGDPGPLAGIPVSVKDLYGVSGERTFAGGQVPLPAAYEHSGTMVRRVQDQLSVIIGKTHTVQWAFGGIGINSHWGTPRNPWANDGHRVPGGSSSGAGVSLHEGSAWVALGTDTAGSVRIPAAWTGNVGIKTTKHRWPTDGIVPLSPTLDTPGLLTRTVDDAMYAFCAMDGPVDSFTERLRSIPVRAIGGLRLGYSPELFGEQCSPGVMESIESAVASLARAGASIVSSPLAGVEVAWSVFQEGGTASVELMHFLTTQLPEYLSALDPVVEDRIQAASSVSAVTYLERLARLQPAVRAAKAAFVDVDAFITPTVAVSPPLVSDLTDMADYRRNNLLSLRNTGIVSMLNLCAVSLPCGVDALGIPVGLQLVGLGGEDESLLGVARTVSSFVGL